MPRSNRNSGRSNRGGSRRGSNNGGGRSSSSGLFGMSMWLTIGLGCVALGGLVYGLMQIDSISEFMDPVVHDVGEFFGLSEDDSIDTSNITHDRTYSGVGA